MKRTLTTLAAATALGAATLAAPSPASAQFAEWIIPAIIGAGILGVGVGAAANNPPPPAYAEPAPAGTVYVQPTTTTRTATTTTRTAGSCRIVRERIPGGTRRVRICD